MEANDDVRGAWAGLRLSCSYDEDGLRDGAGMPQIEKRRRA